MPRSMTEEQLETFRTQGYARPFRAISGDEARECRRRLEAYEAQVGHDGNKTLKIKAHLAFPWMCELARNTRILDVVEDVIGPNVLLFGASLFAKSARDHRFVSWHQDSAYFGLTPHEEVTAWVAFTDSTIANGCLRVMPRTHLGPDLQHRETYAADNLLARGQTIDGLDESQAVDLELEAGQFSIHHERTAHGSLANPTDDRRIGLAFFYIPTHVRSTLGRRSAMLVRGVDTHGHWDGDVEPRFDLDPVSMARLRIAWGEYSEGKIPQAAEAERS